MQIVYFGKVLSTLFSDPLPVGASAPDWTLRDQDGNAVSLASLRGRNVVLVFYPRDETPTCRAQLCEFRDAWEQAKAKNTVVFGINPQKASSHAGFRENNKLPFPLLVDEGGKVCSAYNTRGLMTKRTVYLIGPDGTIRYAKRGKPPVEEVLAAAA
jgi:thioredoxin-dependent peroxiredoxin